MKSPNKARSPKAKCPPGRLRPSPYRRSPAAAVRPSRSVLTCRRAAAEISATRVPRGDRRGAALLRDIRAGIRRLHLKVTSARRGEAEARGGIDELMLRGETRGESLAPVEGPGGGRGPPLLAGGVPGVVAGGSDGGVRGGGGGAASYWQNVWAEDGIGGSLTFPTACSVRCPSADEGPPGLSMPGVHALHPFEGGGYVLVGLVSSDVEKERVRRWAGLDWSGLPLMAPVADGICLGGSMGMSVTVRVDSARGRAELFVSRPGGGRESDMAPRRVWSDLPPRVWAAVAFKRSTAREAVLMPCVRWAGDGGGDRPGGGGGGGLLL